MNKTLQTARPDLTLEVPDINRDAAPSLRWLNGPNGRETLALMGVTHDHNKPSNIQAERERIKGFLSSSDQLTWTMRYRNETVGAIWVTLLPTKYLPAPSLHIMIGDSEVRGKGLGSAACKAVVSSLSTEFRQIYTRHLLGNEGSAALMQSIGFKSIGSPYHDEDELSWQNLCLKF